MVEERPLKVCYFGTYRANYARNRINITRLRRAGCEVVECHARLWHGDADRQAVAAGGWKKPAFWWRTIKAYLTLLWRYTRVGAYDVMVVGYPGQPDVLLARLLSWIRRKPLVWDILMSIYLIARERNLEERSPALVAFIHRLEWFALRLPDGLIVDTQEYANWYCDHYRISRERIRLLPLGADDRVYAPRQGLQQAGDGFVAVYYGSFIPNHGVTYIVEAAHLLRDRSEIRFLLIGDGPEREEMIALADSYALQNVTFVEWLDQKSLVDEVQKADVVLGTFGKTPQALMTIQNKIYEGLAMAKPVLNGDSEAVRSVFQHGVHLYLCEREDPVSLAEALLDLYAHPELRRRLSERGHLLYREKFSFDKLGARLVEHLEAVSRRGGA